MTDRTSLGLGVLAAGLAIGVAADVLLRVSPWGINVLAWMITLVIAVMILLRWRGIQLLGGGRWLVLAAIFFAGALAWRDSLTLGIVNVLTVLFALALAGARSRFGQLRVATMLQYVLDIVFAGVFALIGLAVLVFNDIGWDEIPRSGLTRQAFAIVRGLIIGIPLVIFFGVLFMAADAVFQGMAEGFFRWLLADVISHIVLILASGWLVAGFLRYALVETDWIRIGGDGISFKPFGIVEAGTVLGMLNILFLVFVLVQFRFFFGGSAMVQASADLTYAEYARRGFFELITVAALTLPLLLAADWLVRRDNGLQRRVFRLLVVSLVALLFVIMASALQRMRLYQEEFGMTELRLYATVFMGWIGLVFFWFLATVARGRRDQFAFGMLVAGFLAVAFLNVIDPDATIVRINVNRVKGERPIDARYASSLSADAVPVLVELLPEVPEKERQQIAESLLKRSAIRFSSADWRSWNLARMQADLAIDMSLSKLRGVTQPNKP